MLPGAMGALLLDRLGGVAKRLGDVLGLQVGIGREDLGGGHPVRHHAHDRGHGDAHSPDARDAPHLVGVDGDALEHHQVVPPGLVGRLSGRGLVRLRMAATSIVYAP